MSTEQQQDAYGQQLSRISHHQSEGDGGTVHGLPGPGRRRGVMCRPPGRSMWERPTSQEPGSFGSNTGFVTCVGAPRPTFKPLAPAANVMFTSRPTMWRRRHSASVIGRTGASSNSFSTGLSGSESASLDKGEPQADCRGSGVGGVGVAGCPV